MENLGLRVYEENTPQCEFYKQQHKIQTYDYVLSKLNQYKSLDNETMSMKKALSMLDDFVDPSDPDVDLPNSVHAYQTAERIRKKHPLEYELQITGLIHDLGKVLFKFGEESHTVVGDTYVVGAEFPKSIVYYDTLKDNDDFNNPMYNDKKDNFNVPYYSSNFNSENDKNGDSAFRNLNFV